MTDIIGKKKELENKANMDIYTVQQYNYDKYGYFLNPTENKKLFEVRKERHFVDFSKTPKQLEKEINMGKEDLKAVTVSSKFDIPQQLIVQSPLTYDQYQVFQQACTHLLYFNEFLQVEKFIREKFQGLKCFLKKRDAQEMKMQREKEKAGQLSFDQIISQSKENLQSDMEPSVKSRNVFINPNDSEFTSEVE